MVSFDTVFSFKDPNSGGGIDCHISSGSITQKNPICGYPAFHSELLANIHDPLIAVDENYLFTYWNKAAEWLFGWSEEEVIGKSARDVFQAIVPDSTRGEATDRVLEDGYYEGEVYYRRKDGSYVLTYVRSNVLKDGNGAFKGTVTTFVDAAEKRSVEVEAEKNKNRVREVLNSITDTFMALGRNWDILYANESFAVKRVARALGLEGSKDFVGKNYWQVFPKYIGTSMEDNLRAAMETREIRRWQIKSVITDRWLECTAYPSSEGLAVMFADFTERKELEDRLACEIDGLSRLHEMSMRLFMQDEMRGLFYEFLHAAIALVHSEMGTIQMIDSTGNLRIVSQHGFKQPFLDFFGLVTPESDAACGLAKSTKKRVAVEDVTTSPIFVGTEALKVQLEAGVRAVQSTPLITRSGEMIGVISTHYREPRVPSEEELRLLDLLARQAADLIERMNHKQQLDSYARKLEGLVKERTKELEQALESERRSRREAILLQDILTHDIRNYNQVTKLSAELLLEELKGNEQVGTIVQHQISSLDAMTELLERAKKLSKLFSESKPSLHSVNVLSTIRDAIDLISSSSNAKQVNHTLRIVLPEGEKIFQGGGKDKIEDLSLYVVADDFLVDVFLNLYSNALKHGGGLVGSEIFIETTIEQDPVIEPSGVSGQGSSAMDPARWLKISISDNGKGIRDELKSKVFSRFESGTKGTGLGMSIVHTLVVERYKGRIKVKDRIEGDYTKGALFEFLLPRAK